MSNRACSDDGYVRQSAPVSEEPIADFLRGWVLFLPNCLIRRELLLKVGGYPTELRTGEDLLLLFRLLKEGARLVHTTRSLLLVRQHPEKQISSEPSGVRDRAADQLCLTAAVFRELAGHPMRIKALAAARHSRAKVEARKLGVKLKGTLPEVSLMDQCWYLLGQPGIRVRKALSVRLHGHRIEPHYHPLRITRGQLNAIYDMGLEPGYSPSVWCPRLCD